MNILSELKSRFAPALAEVSDDPAPLLDMIRPVGNPQHGDYQANFAMPLKKQLGNPPHEIAADILAQVDVADLCETPEVAGPGFINLKLKDAFLIEQLNNAFADERLGVPVTDSPKTIVIDYSSPNVAKPMHVGHIRSTVIGDSLARTLRFLGHNVITDNHLGDWGTQFGMIIYGWKHFGDQSAYDENPVGELVRVYRQVRRLSEYFEARCSIPDLNEKVAQVKADIAAAEAVPTTGDKKADKKAASVLKKLIRQHNELHEETDRLAKVISDADADHDFAQLLQAHSDIERDCRAETAKLHDGDSENLALWHKFLPQCRQEIQRIYDRLDVRFDHELGESFYHDRLAHVVESLESAGIAEESAGATCVFVDGFEAPMMIRKSDGAFLYATTDLATLQYRTETWQPDVILYVVDHRQADHFQMLFHTARLWGMDNVDLRHIKFGTVMKRVVLNGKERIEPFKTRAGDTAGLEGLLDDAVAHACHTVSELDDRKKDGPQLSDDERKAVGWTIGHAAIKYTDLSQNRESDYVFDLDEMVALDGDTATYMEYAFARVNGIFAKGAINREQLSKDPTSCSVQHVAERALGLKLLQFTEALENVVIDFRPNLLTSYLYDLAKCYSVFFEKCHVLKAETEELRISRLKLCDLTAGVLRQGLALLGIDVVERM